jgi:hypothetical protein
MADASGEFLMYTEGSQQEKQVEPFWPLIRLEHSKANLSSQSMEDAK